MLAVWPRAGYPTSPSLSVLICTWSRDGTSFIVFARLAQWLASVGSQDCRLLAWVLWVCDKVIPQRSFPRHCLRQAGPRRQCPVAPGRPLPSLCHPPLPYCFLAASATRCCEGAPHVSLPGEAPPRSTSRANQRSDPVHLQKPSKTGIFPPQVESGVPPVKRVPKNPVLRPPPPPSHTGVLPALPPQVAWLPGGQLQPPRVLPGGRHLVKSQQAGRRPATQSSSIFRRGGLPAARSHSGNWKTVFRL